MTGAGAGATATTDRHHLTSVARGGALNLVAAGVNALANVALVVLVTRGLPQTTAGAYFTVTALFVLLAMVTRLGSGTGLVYHVSRLRAWGKSDQVGRVLGIALRPVVVLSVLVAVALVIAAPLLAPLVVHGHRELATSYIRQVAVFLPFAVVADLFQATTRGYGAMRPTAVVDKIGRPLVQIPVVAALAATGGLALAGGWAVPYLPAAAVSAWWLIRLRRRRTTGGASRAAEPAQDAVRAREYWAYALPRAFAGIAQIALQRLDIILVGALRGPAAAAIYAAATRFLVVGQLGNQAISMAVQPRVSALLANGEHRATAEVYQTSTGWLVLLTWPLYLLCAVFSTQVLLIFGSGYGGGRIVMVILALTMLVATGCGMVDVLLTMGGRTTWNLANVLVALAVNIGIDVALIPHYGILGAAIGWAAALLAKNLLPLTQVWRGLGLHPFGVGTLTGAGLAAGCFGLLPLVAWLASGGGLAATGVAAGVGLLAYAASLWLLRRPLRLDLLATSLPLPPVIMKLRGRHSAPKSS